MAPRLKPAARVAIDAASPIQVQLSLGRFANAGANGWTLPGSAYPNGRFPGGATFLTVPPQELVSAIAVRGPLHCIDGWGYLGRSINALASGNPHSARHLAYYAELRGALSILASQGIGNFNDQNVCVDATGVLSFVQNVKTHDMAWLALARWSRAAKAFDAIASAIDVAGVSLLEAIKAFFPSPSSQRLGASIIRSWGFDLGKMQRDKFERNNSSYQPNELTDISTLAAEDIDFFESFWSAFEPESFNLETYLLRSLLEQQSRELTRRTSLKRREVEYSRLDSRIQRYVSIEFLERTEKRADHPIQQFAALTTMPAHATAMIARAALLLRLATALVDANFKAASVDPLRDLGFWWTDFGTRRGFWPMQAPAQPLSELWLDVVEALQEARTAAPPDRFGWLSQVPLGLPRICEADRIPLWALCR